MDTRKPTQAFQRLFPERHAEDLSLSGGASILLSASPSQHHLLRWLLVSLRERRRRPVLDRPPENRYAASRLAHAPLREGSIRTDQAAVPAGSEPVRDRRCLRGRGKESKGGHRVHQVSRGGQGRRIAHPPTERKQIAEHLYAGACKMRSAIPGAHSRAGQAACGTLRA